MTSQTIIPPTSGAEEKGRYGAFMDRFIALLIDYILLYIIQFVLLFPLVVSLFTVSNLVTAPFFVAGVGYGSFVWIMSVLFYWLYFAGMESSAWGATLGKRAMNLRVVDMNGARLTFGRASLRYFFKMVSAFPLLLGFFMALFTKKKQALHDLVAQTVVLSV